MDNLVREVLIQGEKSFYAVCLIFVAILITSLFILIKERRVTPLAVAGAVANFFLIGAMGLVWMTQVLLLDGAGHASDWTRLLDNGYLALLIMALLLWLVTAVVLIIRGVRQKHKVNNQNL